MAGFPDQNFVKKLSGELNRKFGVQAPMVSPAESNATTVLLAYAYLSRSLPFPGRFARSRTTKIAFCYGKETNPTDRNVWCPSQAAAICFRQAVPGNTVERESGSTIFCPLGSGTGCYGSRQKG